jgi:hypothetical protein
LLQRRHRLIFLLGIALACGLSPVSTRAQGDTGEEPIGFISILCGDLSIALSLDDTALGPCPVESLQVPAGRYTLTGWPVEGRRHISSFFSRTVNVRAGLETLIDISDLRWIRLETAPFGALVSRGGIPIGRTPITISVTGSDPPVLLEKEGYRVAPISAGSLLSGPATRRVDLEPEPGLEIAAQQVSAPAGRSHFGFKTITLGMSVLASATIAVALSKEADDTFEEYKTAGDLDRMNSLFNKAESLDTWSVGCWIVSEVALGLLLYHLLHDHGPAPGDAPTAGTLGGHEPGGPQ